MHLAGTCAQGSLTVLVDGTPVRLQAERMPRPDLGAAVGWWATARIAPRPAGTAVRIAARAAGAETTLATLPVTAAPPAEERPPATARTIAVALATYEPDPALLRAQIESLRAQDDPDWVCVVADDASSPEGREALAAAIGDDPRFRVVHHEQRLGFYGNFERALGLVPAGAGLVALCDQDDVWHPDKLSTLRSAMEGGATLAFSDQRLVDPAGAVLRPTMWRGRAVNHTSLADLLVANSVTGASALLRRDVADLSVPFPRTPGLQFHDHWIALVALAAGALAYVDRPLYDYVQHAGAVFGDVRGDGRPPYDPRAAYFNGFLAREVAAQALLARVGERIAPAKRRVLERFAAAQRSPAALAWLAARALRRGGSTLGSEAELAGGVLWRHAATARARLGLGGDARVPDPLAFQQRRLRAWRAGW